MNLFFCKSLFSLLSKAILNRGKRRQNLTFCDPSINRSVHNSICVCVEASMWKHAGLRDIKPFPLNIIWPYESYSQKKAYVRISWKKCKLSLCYRGPTHFTPHSPGKLIMEVTLVQELVEGMAKEHNTAEKKKAHMKNKPHFSLKYRSVLSLAGIQQGSCTNMREAEVPTCSSLAEFYLLRWLCFSCYTKIIFFFHDPCPPRGGMAISFIPGLVNIFSMVFTIL